MSGNDAKVLVDLNAPTFQDDLFGLDVPDLKKVFKTLKKIRKMVWNDVFVDRNARQTPSFRAVKDSADGK